MAKTYHRCNKEKKWAPLSTIKSRIGRGMPCTAQLWEKVNFYIIIIKNLWTFSAFHSPRDRFVFHPPRWRRRKKNSLRFFCSLLQRKKISFARTRGSPYPIWKSSTWWLLLSDEWVRSGRRKRRRKWLLIRLAVPNIMRQGIPPKTESFCVGKRIIIL